MDISLTPPSLRATSPIFCVVEHPVILQDTAGRSECFAMPQGIGEVVKGVFSFWGIRIDFTLLPGVAYACAGQEDNSILSLTLFCVFLDLAPPFFERSRYIFA